MPEIKSNTAKTINFTVEALNRLPCPSKGATTYRDSQNSHLRLYVTPSGTKTFFVRRRVHGKDQRILVGGFPTLTVFQARQKATALAADIDLGLDPLEQKRKEQAARLVTLADRCRNYIEHHCKRRNKRWREQEKDAEKYLKPLARRPFHEITRSDVERLHTNIGQRAPVKANRIWAFICSVYSYEIKKGWQGANPAKGIDRFPETSRDRFVMPEEMPFLLQAIEAEPCPTARDYFSLLLLTGARKTNVLRMQWADIHWQLRHWRIPDSKNGKPVLVPLVDKAYSMLEARRLQVESRWVFPQKGNPSKPVNNPEKAWKRIKARATLLLWQRDDKLARLIETVQGKASHPCGEDILVQKVMRRARDDLNELPAGLLDLRIHDLRRTCGSYQAITGASLQIIGKSLGHKSIEATQIYARLNLDPVRAAMEKASAAMLSAGA